MLLWQNVGAKSTITKGVITMDHVHSTTTEHKKGKHLSCDEKILIQLRLKDNWSANKIAKEIGCAPNTIRNEIHRGNVSLYQYHGNVNLFKEGKKIKTLL